MVVKPSISVIPLDYTREHRGLMLLYKIGINDLRGSIWLNPRKSKTDVRGYE